jgi:3',5'-nucleoside bisphosphate phosphatase
LIDLHTHSTASDGSFAPKDLIDHAIQRGVMHLALTDHDTVDGIPEALESSKDKIIDFLAGVEVSAEFQDKTMHILGFGLDHTSSKLNDKLKVLRQSRADRNPKIIKKLSDAGFDISIEDAVEISGGKVVGRPHMARVLFEKGYVSSVQEAFDLYLAKGKPCYVDKFRFNPAEAISMIIEGGGLPALAHPLSLELDYEELGTVVKMLKDSGLEGMECFYRNHTVEQENSLLRIAEEFGLTVTGGSDFHGSNRPAIQVGTGEGQMRVPAWVWKKLSKKLAEKGRAAS